MREMAEPLRKSDQLAKTSGCTCTLKWSWLIDVGSQSKALIHCSIMILDSERHLDNLNHLGCVRCVKAPPAHFRFDIQNGLGRDL